MLKINRNQMLECKEANQIKGGINGSEILMSENKEEFMTIYNYREVLMVCQCWG